MNKPFQYSNYLDNSNYKKRDSTFDLLKLYAMLSVVLDHSLQHMIGGGIQQTLLYNWIFLSQMPIFMFVSGYFSSGNIYKNTTFIDFLRKIVKIIFSLFIPFMSFAIIKSLIERENLVIKSILYPDNSLWFLWALMWMQIIMLVAQQISKCFFKNMRLRIIASLGFYLLGLFPVVFMFVVLPELFQTKLIIFYSIFYLFGFFYSLVEKQLIFLKNDKFKLFDIIIQFVIITLIMATHPQIIFESETLYNIFARLIGSFAAIMLMMNMMSFIAKSNLINRFAVFGTVSLEMYYIHLLLIELPFFNFYETSLFVFIIKYMLLVFISMIIIATIKKNQLLDFLIFGKFDYNK